VDAALGLLLLRESQPLNVYATDSVRRLLVEDNNFFAVLRRQPDQVRWKTMTPGESIELESIDGQPTGIICNPVSTGGAFPGHVSPDRAAQLDVTSAVLGLFLQQGSKRMAFFPGAHDILQEWPKEMAACDAIFFDGTFWSNDELIRIQGQGKTARQMGHLPVADPGGTLDRFSSLAKPRKIFIHINNTNPMLDETSPEYTRMRASGWELAFDGMELCL
jgi:pyrroloquinoline quinone biosynthesis protein B